MVKEEHLTITQFQKACKLWKQFTEAKAKKCKSLFCYTEMARIDLLRQLGNFNWGPG